eukprot:gnl/MRDRNA2_/MRDRNA2_96617_c0_seq1.p1 gnl/MRDRNA2_/MRDRNA2_96617_c0~~gnl/MRDRNA2_/MRDRNA2_96617_c0_seq1.p1  ORF type:complete len:441 (+),score=103.12 gnl/MRDRNA2_/MRDRNA2_96617_c0_seq1:116-1438(+)
MVKSSSCSKGTVKVKQEQDATSKEKRKQEDKHYFDERMEETKKLELQDWPKDIAVDDGLKIDIGRWPSWLPEEWTAATKMTVNDCRLDCYVGPTPERKMYFHKADIEKYLGKKLPIGLRGPKPRSEVKKLPKDSKEFNLEHYLECTGIKADAQYIEDRCRGVHGMQIKEALQSFKFKQPTSHSQMKLGVRAESGERHYSVADLRYDMKCKRLKQVETKPVGPPPDPVATAPKAAEKKPALSTSEDTEKKPPGQRKLPKVSQVARSLKVRRTIVKKSKEPKTTSTGTAMSSSSKASSSDGGESSGGSVATKKRKGAPSTPPISCTPTFEPKTPPVRTSLNVAPITPSPVNVKAPSTPPCPSMSTAEELRRMLNSFKSKQAATQVDEIHIWALKGFGYEHGFDEIALSMFGKVAAKHPIYRKPLDDHVIETLDEEFRRIIGR